MPNGRVYAVSAGHGQLVVLDPNENTHRRARHSDARAEGEGAVALPGAESSVAALGQRASLGQPAVQPGRSAQPDARQQGPRVDDVEDSRQCRIRRGAATPTNKFAEWFPLRSSGRQASFYDPKTQAVHADRHLLRHAPPAVRQRSERDGVLQRADRPDRSAGSTRRSTTRRKDEQKAVRLVRAGARHQRRRQDHATPWNQITRSRRFAALRGRHHGRQRRRRRGAGGAAARAAASIRSSTRWSATACTA